MFILLIIVIRIRQLKANPQRVNNQDNNLDCCYAFAYKFPLINYHFQGLTLASISKSPPPFFAPSSSLNGYRHRGISSCSGDRHQ